MCILQLISIDDLINIGISYSTVPVEIVVQIGEESEEKNCHH
jgi:hypothetical protein